MKQKKGVFTMKFKDSKRITAIIAALMSVCIVTAGCASNESSSSDTLSEASSVSAETSSEADSSSSASNKSVAQANSGKKGRESQTINIDPPEDADNSASGKDASDVQLPWKNKENGGAANGSTAAVTATGESKLDASDMFSDRDLKQEADTSGAKTITVSDGQTIDITEEGVYILKGSAKDCTVKVNASKDAKVQLVLDGVEIENSDFPAVYVVNADKCFITLAAGSSNSLSVTGAFKSDGDTKTDAVIFSKDDLVLNGTGSLKISSAQGNGISGKDDLKITGGTYDITSAKDSVEANDSIRISGGSFRINSSKDGFHAENDDDSTAGYIYISGGSFDITSKSDGVQATTVLQIDGGTFNISSSEGLESTYIQINGGDITVKASDDGVNASNKSSSETPFFEMTGGKLNVTVSGGDVDAIDVNGSLSVSGGEINITCPSQGMCESFDYDGNASFTGGAITVNGEKQDSIPTPKMGGGRGGFGGGQGGFPGQDGQNGFPGQDGQNGFPGQDGQNGQGGFGGRGRMRGNNTAEQ